MFRSDLILLMLSVTLSQAQNNGSFLDDFLFGVATASYQIEGGWDADGKSENIWDKFTHEHSSLITDKSNGDIACDSYNKYKIDVELLKSLGAKTYRFSLSWSRILPNGIANEINQAGVDYYIELIKLLKDNGIEPLVTIYHWDLPEALQKLGGWTTELVVDWFGDYARTVFTLFGDDVKYWITLNEPISFCLMGYGEGLLGELFAPMVNSSGIGEYLCGHNALKAHARAWHIYQKYFKKTQKGEVGITLVSHWFGPDGTYPPEGSAEQRLQFMLGWFAHPLFKGDYPQIMKDKIANRSVEQGFPRSRLPQFTRKEIEYIKGTVDFLGLNSYTSFLTIFSPTSRITTLTWAADSGVIAYISPDWTVTSNGWISITPWAIQYLSRWLTDNYNSPRIFITENGMPDNCSSSALEDDQRIYFLQTYLSSLLDGILNYGVNVFGYTAWSLMDNFEWSSGYTQCFGLHQVDFNNANRTRTPKKSAIYYQKVIETKCIYDDCTY